MFLGEFDFLGGVTVANAKEADLKKRATFHH
jgi:hypothetical protein